MKNLHKNNILRYRYENFGGIISSAEPAFLAFVDRTYMRELGLGESCLWQTCDQSIGFLSAPSEVHFAVTNRCGRQCPHCYMASGQRPSDELDTASVKNALDVLSGLKVFHVALGGGEALLREDLFEIATYARAIGIIPNLTISGAGITDEVARKMLVFGQVNLSVDSVDPQYQPYRDQAMFKEADRAIGCLLNAGVPTGINCVVGKRNFDGIAQIFQYAADKQGINEIEFLRFKPAGRGKALYDQEKTTRQQNRNLVPMLIELSQKFSITAKIDCSFVPMLCYHQPDPQALEKLATYGCEAGNVLLGIGSNGLVSGCSFLESPGLSVFDLAEPHMRKSHFYTIHTWPQRAKEPCRSCSYLAICKGGCHGVALHCTGNFDNPDPDCPWVAGYSDDSLANAATVVSGIKKNGTIQHPDGQEQC
ncbi:MAG: radical SAM protein [Desulfobacteraceae bacterium]|nr:radical SAM protein [Desulfobacteraceae bacterium]